MGTTDQMSKQDLILLRNDASLAITVTPEALAAKQEALENARMVQVISTAKGQAMAVAAQAELQRLISACEKSRKDVKAPVLDFGRLIDDTAKRFIEDLVKEHLRLSRSLGDFQVLEAARVRSEESARNEKLTDIERQREAELAQAPTLEAREVIHERFAQEVQAVSPPPAPVRAEGQIVRSDIDFEVVDLRALAMAHWHLVKCEPRRSEIKEALKAGLTVTGVKSWSVTKSSVRT